MDHGKTDLGVLFHIELGNPVMGAPLTNVLPARAPGNDMEFCPFFSDDNVMNMLDLFTSEKEACLDWKNII
jgi:hypothetical protein